MNHGALLILVLREDRPQSLGSFFARPNVDGPELAFVMQQVLPFEDGFLLTFERLLLSLVERDRVTGGLVRMEFCQRGNVRLLGPQDGGQREQDDGCKDRAHGRAPHLDRYG